MGAGALKATVGTLRSPARSGQWFRELRNVPLWGYEDGQWTCRGAGWVLGEQVWDELGARGTWAGQWGVPEGGAALLVLMSPPLTPVASQTSPGSPSLPGPARRPLQQACPFPPPEALGWTPWAPWSACSQSCLALGGGPGWRSRSRLCPSSGNSSCPGEDTQEEPCSPPVCPGMSPSVPGVAWVLGCGEETRRPFGTGPTPGVGRVPKLVPCPPPSAASPV